MNFGEPARPNAVPYPISVVNACLRDGRGGSPTAIVDERAPATLTDAERSRVPARCGTSHAVFVTRQDPGRAAGTPTHHEGRAAAEESTVDLRFFTAEGELPACGHGTIAAVAFLAGQRQGAEQELTLSVSGRTFTARAVRDGDRIHAAFDPGSITLREPTRGVTDLSVDMGGALGCPATITTSARRSPTSPTVLVGGAATITCAGIV